MPAAPPVTTTTFPAMSSDISQLPFARADAALTSKSASAAFFGSSTLIAAD
jgi:hypothetical protein